MVLAEICRARNHSKKARLDRNAKSNSMCQRVLMGCVERAVQVVNPLALLNLEHLTGMLVLLTGMVELQTGIKALLTGTKVLLTGTKVLLTGTLELLTLKDPDQRVVLKAENLLVAPLVAGLAKALTVDGPQVALKVVGLVKVLRVEDPQVVLKVVVLQVALKVVGLAKVLKVEDQHAVLKVADPVVVLMKEITKAKQASAKMKSGIVTTGCKRVARSGPPGLAASLAICVEAYPDRSLTSCESRHIL